MKHLFTLLMAGWVTWGHAQLHPASRDVPERPFDVLHYNITLDVTDFAAERIFGEVEVTFIRKPGTDTLRLELLGMHLNRVTHNDKPLPHRYNPETGELLLLAGKLDRLDTLTYRISYDGHPVKPSWFGGFYFQDSIAYNLGILIDGDPPNFGKAFFPCVDDFHDRATYDITLIVPPGMTGVATGRFNGGTSEAGRSPRVNWKMEQPIPTYLVSVAVGEYEHVQGTYHSVLQGRDIPTDLYVRPEDAEAAAASFVNLNKALAAFEDRFGPYVWPRVGYVSVPMRGGAMEHATNVAYPHKAVDSTLNFETLWAHELSHSWFGNTITCHGAEEMWLNEGFARYCEGLFREAVYGEEAFQDWVRELTVRSVLTTHLADGQFHPVTPVPAELTYSSTTYDRGALMVHFLRGQVGDEAFFQAMRNLLATKRFQNWSTLDLQTALENASGLKLAAVFRDWVFGTGWALGYEWPSEEPSDTLVPIGFTGADSVNPFPERAARGHLFSPFELKGMMAAVYPNAGYDLDNWLPDATIHAYVNLDAGTNWVPGGMD